MAFFNNFIPLHYFIAFNSMHFKQLDDVALRIYHPVIKLLTDIDQSKLKNFYLIALQPPILKGCKFITWKVAKI